MEILTAFVACAVMILAGSTQSSTTLTLDFHVSTGEREDTVEEVDGYVASPKSGKVKAGRPPVYVEIEFEEQSNS